MASQQSIRHLNMSPGTVDMMPTHRECFICQQLLERHLFTKREYKKPLAITCQQCKRNLTAKRCKQAIKPNIQQGRRSGKSRVL